MQRASKRTELSMDKSKGSHTATVSRSSSREIGMTVNWKATLGEIFMLASREISAWRMSTRSQPKIRATLSRYSSSGTPFSLAKKESIESVAPPSTEALHALSQWENSSLVAKPSSSKRVVKDADNIFLFVHLV